MTKELSFEHLLKNSIPPLRRFARHCLRYDRSGELEPEDLLQMTLLRMWAKQKLYTPNTNFLAWAMTVMANIFRSWKHKQAASKRDLQKKTNLGASANLVIDHRASAELTILTKEVIATIEKLPEIYGDILRYRASEMSYIEIRKELSHLGSGTINSRLARGRDALANLTYYEGRQPK